MKAESPDAHAGENVVDELDEHMMHRAHLFRINDILRISFINEEVHNQQGNRGYDCIGKTCIEVSIHIAFTDFLEEEGREEKCDRAGKGAAILLGRYKLRLFGSNLRHFSWQRRSRYHDHREVHLVEDICHDIELEAVACRPEHRIGKQYERCTQKNEELSAAKALAESRAAEVIADIAHDRIAYGVDEAGNRENESCLYRRNIAGCCVEEHKEG